MNQENDRAPNRGPERTDILLVEDAQGFAQIVTRVLDRAGFAVTRVATGAQALGWLSANHARLVLLDFSLPDMCGRDIVEKLKAAGRDLPFIIITGNGDERVAVDMMKLGALDYLVKDEAFLTLLPSVVAQTFARLETEQRLVAAEERLDERQKHLRAFADALPDKVFVLDGDGRLVESLSSEHRLASLWPELRTGGLIYNCLSEDNAHLFRDTLRQTLASHQTRIVEYAIDGRCGRRWFEGRVAPVGLPGSRPMVVWVVRDISDRKKSEEELRKLLRAIEQGPGVVVITDRRGRIEYVNPAFCAATGYSAEEVEGQSPRILKSQTHPPEFYRELWETVSQGREWRGEFVNRRKNGALLWERAVISPVKDDQGRITHFLKVAEDISERKSADERIHSLTYYDPLTDLPNQILFRDRLRQAMASAQRTGEKVGVVVVDIDQFQRINNAFAHGFGDKVLKETARRLQAALREEDTVARFWGDSFLLELPRLHGEEDLLLVAHKVRAAFVTPFRIDQREIFLTVSLGMALFPSDGTSPEVLLKNAEAALARSKEGGSNGFQLYAPSMNVRASESLMLQSDLRKAIDRKEFVLFYQPQLDVNSRRVIGAEALVRWRHPVLGLLFPDKFIALAEESNLICPLGEWVILDACRQLRAWQDAGCGRLQLSINLSPRQFHGSDCLAVIEKVVRECGVDPRQLTFEITETLIMKNTEQAIAALKRLKALTCRLAIDDFGTGYSSLSYLQKFPLDLIKIDKSFVMQCERNPQDAAICRTIIAMAHALGLRVLAEGVEKEEHYRFLLDNGCHEMQGYLFSKPVPVAEFAERWLPQAPPLQ